MNRVIALLAHDRRNDVRESIVSMQTECASCGVDAHIISCAEDLDALPELELIVVIGGDGSILRAAELVHDRRIPILGINYGHIGFLAEADPSSQSNVVAAIANHEWSVDQRMTIDISVRRPSGEIVKTWALNEASIEKSADSRMIETDIGVDGEPVSSFKTDAVLLSTPTGSTAYNFSAGGPIVWPDVQAILLTPVAAHALFTRPMVVGPNSRLDVQIRTDDAVVWCDGRRSISAPAGSTLSAVKGANPVLLARLNNAPFSERLVKKFHLPVQGWRSDTPFGSHRQGE